MFNKLGNLDFDSYIMESDSEGPFLNCSICGERLKHGDKVVVIGDERLDEICSDDLSKEIQKLNYPYKNGNKTSH